MACFQEKRHHEKNEYNELRDHNNDSLYGQDCNQEKHTQRIELSVWCIHEMVEERNMCSQKHEDDHKQQGTHGELLQDTCLEDEMRVEDLLNRLQ